MPLTTVNVTGTVLLPDGSEATGAVLEFALSASDADLTSNYAVPQSTVKVVLGSGGSLTVNLWPNDRGDGGTFYRVTAYWVDYNGKQVKANLGTIQPLKATDPADFNDLLSVAEHQQGVIVYQIGEDEYNDILAEAASIEASAQTSADNAATSASTAATYAQAASSSASTAASHASAASSSASAASTSEGNAETSANNASASAAAASASADNAQLYAEQTYTNISGEILQFDTRAEFVTWATSNSATDGRIAWADGIEYIAEAGATAIPDLQGWLPNGDITPLHFQENTTPGTTDMATGFAAMFAYWETLDVVSTTNANFRALFHRSVSRRMRIPAGKYFTTYEWLPNSANGRSIVIEGDGAYQTVIQMPVDGSEGYFLRFPLRDPYENPYHFVDIRGVKFVGGKGVYMNEESAAPFVQRGVSFIDVDALGFTECAFGSLWGDDPRWNFSRVKIETTAANTKGIYLPKGVANPHFEDVTILGCTYRIVTAGDFQSTSVLSGLKMFSLVGDDHEADIWFKTIPVTSSNDGRGFIVTGNRFSSENRNGKPIILIADGDGVGTDITEGHSTAVSTRRFRDWKFAGNTVSGAGSADESPSGPMIVTYTTDIGRAEVSGNSFNVGFTQILWLASDPVGATANGFIIGPNQFSGGGETPQPCNRPFGIWRNIDGSEILSASTPVGGDGGIDPSFELVNVDSSSARITMGTVTASGASLISTGFPDAYGFGDSRAVIFSSSSGYLEFNSDATALSGLGLLAGDNYFVEWEAKKTGATLQLSEVDVEIVATMSGGTLTRRVSYMPTSGWRRHRFAIQLPEVPTAFRVRFIPSPDNWSASSDRTQIARPYFYRANRPVSNQPSQVPVLEKASLTSDAAAYAGRIVFVSDEAGGQTLAFSNGTNWLRVQDLAVVS